MVGSGSIKASRGSLDLGPIKAVIDGELRLGMVGGRRKHPARLVCRKLKAQNQLSPNFCSASTGSGALRSQRFMSPAIRL